MLIRVAVESRTVDGHKETAAEAEFVQYPLAHKVTGKGAFKFPQFPGIQTPQENINGIHYRKPHTEKITVIALKSPPGTHVRVVPGSALEYKHHQPGHQYLGHLVGGTPPVVGNLGEQLFETGIMPLQHNVNRQDEFFSREQIQF